MAVQISLCIFKSRGLRGTTGCLPHFQVAGTLTPAAAQLELPAHSNLDCDPPSNHPTKSGAEKKTRRLPPTTNLITLPTLSAEPIHIASSAIMRGTLIFSGSSCPALTGKICENLGMAPADAELTQFSNGETSVRILTSVREKDVFVVQSGSPKINDTIMELLIMISACKGGSANKITGMFSPPLPLMAIRRG